MMRWFLLLCCTPLLFGQEADIRAMLADSVAAWNRGDLKEFVSYYEDSPETTFMGEEVVRGGHEAILGRYHRRYPNRESMGTVEFTNIRVRPLSPELALVTGEFHLKRSETGGGAASGRYTLIVRKSPSGWKIIHDHTS